MPALYRHLSVMTRSVMGLLTMSDLFEKLTNDQKFAKKFMIDYKMVFKRENLQRWEEPTLLHNVRTTQLPEVSCQHNDLEYNLQVSANSLKSVTRLFERKSAPSMKSIGETHEIHETYGGTKRRRFWSEEVTGKMNQVRGTKNVRKLSWTAE